MTLELVRRGYTEAQIAQLWSGNLLRVMGEVEKVAARLQRSASDAAQRVRRAGRAGRTASRCVGWLQGSGGAQRAACGQDTPDVAGDLQGRGLLDLAQVVRVAGLRGCVVGRTAWRGMAGRGLPSPAVPPWRECCCWTCATWNLRLCVGPARCASRPSNYDRNASRSRARAHSPSPVCLDFPNHPGTLDGDAWSGRRRHSACGAPASPGRRTGRAARPRRIAPTATRTITNASGRTRYTTLMHAPGTSWRTRNPARR